MSEKSMWTLIVIAGLALLGVLAWRRGVFARVFGAPAAPKQAGGYPQGFQGGTGPKEYSGGSASTFNTACNTVTKVGGGIGMASGDPRLMAGGAAVTLAGPAICAGYEWAGEKAVEGAKKVGGAAYDVAKTIGGWFS